MCNFVSVEGKEKGVDRFLKQIIAFLTDTVALLTSIFPINFFPVQGL